MTGALAIVAAAALFAERELADHVRLMTGRDPEPGRFIVTAGDAESDGFTIRSKEGVVTVAGESPRGALYGVYELLERFGGCGWYTPWRTVVPKRERFTVPDGVEITERPAFEMRQPSWCSVRSNELFAARCRLNGEVPDGALAHPDPKYGGCPLRFVRPLYTSHTTLVLVPPEKHFAKHPDWFAEVDGRRIAESTQLCMTNPEVVEEAARRALEFAAADPGAKALGVSQMDWGNFCTCPGCRAATEREGSVSGLVLSFVNAVAERIEAKRPDLLVETLVYDRTLVPPKTARPRRNVMICLCTSADYAEPLATCVRPRNVTWKRQYEEWTTWTKNLYQWDYTPNFRWFFLPHPNFGFYAENLRYFRNRGVRWMYCDGQPVPGGDLQDLRCWMLAKLTWNPDLDTYELVERFCRGCYGRGAPYALKACRLELEKFAAHPEIVLHYGAEPRPDVYDAEYYREEIALWQAAENAAADEPDAAFAAAMARYPNLASLILMLAEKCPVYSVTAHPENFARPEELDSLLADELAIRRRAEAKGVHPVAALQRGQNAWVYRTFGRLRSSRPVLAASVATVPAAEMILRDGDCAGGEWNERHGMHVKLLDDGSVEVYPRDGLDALRLFLSDLAWDADAAIALSVRARLPQTTTAEGEAFAVRIKRAGKAVFERKVRLDELGTAWRNIDLGAYRPEGGEKFDVIGAVAGPTSVLIGDVTFRRVDSDISEKQPTRKDR